MQQSDLMIGKKQFKRQGHTYVMGILNVTPDSFSDGGSYPERLKVEMQRERTDIH